MVGEEGLGDWRVRKARNRGCEHFHKARLNKEQV